MGKRLIISNASFFANALMSSDGGKMVAAKDYAVKGWYNTETNKVQDDAGILYYLTIIPIPHEAAYIRIKGITAISNRIFRFFSVPPSTTTAGIEVDSSISISNVTDTGNLVIPTGAEYAMLYLKADTNYNDTATCMALFYE